MKTYFITLATLILLSFSSCEKQDSTVSKDPITLSSEQKQLITSSNAFGFELFKTVVANPGESKNVFVSPLSVSLALTMLYNGAATITKEEMKQALGYAGLTDEQINIANRDLIKALIEVDPKVIMEIANSVWYKNSFQPEAGFLDVNKNYLNADVRSASFDAATKDLINSWVSDKTHDKIKSIVDEIPAGVVMYLINAIYFKGTWKYQFDTKNTQKLDFTPESGSKKQVDFMVQEGTFEYLNNEMFTAVNLPYGDGNYSMFVMLPKADKTCSDIVAAMNDQNWTTWNSNLHASNDIKIYLPKFKFSFKRTLNEDLKALGMQSMFKETADLSGINKNGGLLVSKVLHKTYVDVNEKGTEAAAVTSVEIILTSAGGPVVFKADKPFVFVIKEKDTNSLLFMGIMNEPVTED